MPEPISRTSGADRPKSATVSSVPSAVSGTGESASCTEKPSRGHRNRRASSRSRPSGARRGWNVRSGSWGRAATCRNASDGRLTIRQPRRRADRSGPAVGAMRANTSPNGPATIAMRPNALSVGGLTTVPPSSVTRAAAASVSVTAK